MSQSFTCRFWKSIATNIRTLWVGLFLLGALMASSQHSLSLSQAIQTGLHNNFQIQIAEQQIDIAERNNSWKASGKYPSIDFNLFSHNGYTNQKVGISFLQGNNDAINYFTGDITASIDLDWTLFDGFRPRISKQRFEELERLAEGNLAIAVEESIQQIILAYYQVLIEQERLAVLKEVMDLSKEGVAYQQVRKDYGQAGEFDILQSQHALLNDSTNILLQSIALENAQRLLNLAIGEKTIDKRFQLTDSLQYRAKAYVFNTLSRKMLTNNKGLNKLLIARSLARIERDYRESYRLPTIGLGSGVSQNFDVTKSDAINPNTRLEYGVVPSQTFNYYLQFNANYKLFDAGATRRSIENAKVQELITELNIEDLKRKLNVQLKNTLATYEKQRQVLHISSALIDNARKNLELADEQFRAGQINSFDYRSVQLEYINASQARLNAIYDLQKTETELTRLTGGFIR